MFKSFKYLILNLPFSAIVTPFLFEKQYITAEEAIHKLHLQFLEIFDHLLTQLKFCYFILQELQYFPNSDHPLTYVDL